MIGGKCDVEKVYWCLFVLLIGRLFSFRKSTALAAPDIKVNVSAGIDGKAKYGKGAPYCNCD